jgi:hypothetical protein
MSLLPRAVLQLGEKLFTSVFREWHLTMIASCDNVLRLLDGAEDGPVNAKMTGAAGFEENTKWRN